MTDFEPVRYRAGDGPAPDAIGLADVIPVTLTRRRDAPPIGAELDALADFREAAKTLKTAEIAYRNAQQTYALAVKRLSEEATR